MGDQPPAFDPCECIFSPAGAMRRLISLLRNSQSYCTDEQCFGTPPSPGNNEDTGLTMVYMAIAWVVLAMVLYMMRPQSLRDGNKPSQMRDDHDDDHHSQPPLM
ncbi:small integral membrane protein 14-like [Hydractinia symbiolongicarpus]|uniref:small integral membrane protein 14-like n=1 Tax=Hydractinia symbiolongicarpus TaxID=13093 RepID=UPI002550325F|nr:small integral membrane protein 14-like [Hydractinia symbiolongicarpus]